MTSDVNLAAFVPLMIAALGTATGPHGAGDPAAAGGAGADLAAGGGAGTGAGKGQWRRYQPGDDARILQRMQVRTALSRAVVDGAFELRYQPIVALDTGRTVGMESLIRWRHPTHGVVAPGEFIEVAEESGLIVPIGAWVLEHAVAEAARWSDLPGATPPYLSVNVSPRQLRQPDFTATENTVDRDRLVQIGCRYGQGYLFSPPLSHADAVAWMTEAHAAA